MNAYSISKLAQDAGVSVHVVRDYMMRGLLHPAQRTESGYSIFSETTLARLRFIRVVFESGIGLDELGRLCRAIDADDGGSVSGCVARLQREIYERRKTLAVAEVLLAKISSDACLHLSKELHLEPS